MNTADLREYVYREAAKMFAIPLTREETSYLVDTVISGIVKGLVESEDNKVLLRGFGKFQMVTRKGRTYTVRGSQVDVPDRKTVVFKPGADLVREIKAEN